MQDLHLGTLSLLLCEANGITNKERMTGPAEGLWPRLIERDVRLHFLTFRPLRSSTMPNLSVVLRWFSSSRQGKF